MGDPARVGAGLRMAGGDVVSRPMKKRLFLSVVGAVAGMGIALGADEEKKTEAAADDGGGIKDIRIVVKTSKGDIEATMYASKAPMTVANFLNLASKDYYDGIVFHRVIPDFMIQGGDPTGTGRGGPGYKIPDEFGKGLKHNRPGLFSMANAGPNTGGSQFFITHVPTAWLDGKHAIFGEVTKGQDVVNAIQKGDKIEDIEIKDSTDALFKAKAKEIAAWSKVLGK